MLKVRPKTQPSDAEMEKQLKAVLSWDAMLDSSTINVAVIDRVAYLSGGVDSGFQKAEAQDVASRIKGVSWVRNHLKVEPEFAIAYDDWPYYSYYDGSYYNRSPYYLSETFGPEPYPSDEQIKKKVEASFFWSPFVASDNITVAVHGGVATLTGTVGSWIGWNEADRDARRSAPDVLNRISVKKGGW